MKPWNKGMGRSPEEIRRAVLVKFHKRVIPHVGRCWEWAGVFDKDGYAVIRVRGHAIRAARLSYELYGGTIANGTEIDHLCRNRGCSNPEHLEAVTHRINMLRGDTVAARNAAKTHCKNGHEFSPENTKVTAKNQRSCRACDAIRQRAYTARAALAKVGGEK